MPDTEQRNELALTTTENQRNANEEESQTARVLTTYLDRVRETMLPGESSSPIWDEFERRYRASRPLLSYDNYDTNSERWREAFENAVRSMHNRNNVQDADSARLPEFVDPTRISANAFQELVRGPLTNIRTRPLEIIGTARTSANMMPANLFQELNGGTLHNTNTFRIRTRPNSIPISTSDILHDDIEARPCFSTRNVTLAELEREPMQHPISFREMQDQYVRELNNMYIRDLYPSIMRPAPQHPVSDPSETPSSNQTERERVYTGRGVIASFIPITLQESTETNSEDDDIDYIQSYNYIPDNYIFRKVSDEEELYMGIELEIDKGGEDESSAKFVYNHMNKDGDLVYCKSDSSLDDGFEIVTHPCTFEYHTKIKPMYKSLFKQLSDMKYKADSVSGCGFHVHINRNYFGERKIDQDLGIGKFVYLFSKYLKEITIIARRQTNRYATEISLEKGDSIITAYANAIDIGKYSCVNLMHKNTVEIRLFQGTLNCNIFLLTLEFVKKLAEIARNADMYDMDSITWNDIKNTFSDDLVSYIDNRNKKQNGKKSKNNTNNLVTFTANTAIDAVNSGTVRNLLRRLADSYIGINPFRDDPPLAGARELGIDTSAIGTLINNPNRNYGSMYTIDSLGTIQERPVVVNLPRELTEEEKITKDITDLKAKLKRCRNDFERMNINRSIAKLERDLCIIRHRPVARAQ